MHSALLAAYAVCNVSLFLYPQQSLPDTAWPTQATIALPQGWAKAEHQLFVRENDKPMLAQVEVVARWPDGSPKWLHAHGQFRYAGGKPLKYVLARESALPADMPTSPLKVVDEPAGIRIDTGVIKLVVPRPFTGVSVVEQDGRSLISGAGGPSLIDDRGIEWHAMHDDKAEIVVEQNGPAAVTIKATGWYQTAERRVAPFCRFTTRISAFANSPILKIDHATTFAGEMREHGLAELAFKFALPKATGYATQTDRGTFDDKRLAAWFAQLSADRLFRISQTGPDAERDITVKGDFERSAGWFSAIVGDRRVALLTKDFWQKCPKEVQIASDAMVYYAWPKHGALAPPIENPLLPQNIYKFPCFQSGRLLNPLLPNDYFAALEAQRETTENKAVYARAGSMQGLSVHNEFAIAIVPAGNDAKQTDDYLDRLQRLYHQNPMARVSPTAMASSGAMGPVAAGTREFPEQERAVRDGMLGVARSIPRYGDYGWAIYGNTHHDELMNPQAAGVPGGRPSLHRVWNNNHYQQVSTSWRVFALHGDARLLDWARTCTDCYASIGQVRYDGLVGRLDGNGKAIAGPSSKGHLPGAFFHCKGFVPWGSRDYGMDRLDADLGLTGHWPDPSALLFAWLIDGNRWAKDGYDLWLSKVKFPTSGSAREANTTLVHAITAYEYQPKPETLAAIKSLSKSLRSVPILRQRPGPIWEPTWLSRYHELVPDDEEFNKFLVKSADEMELMEEGMSTLAVSATAYRITGDKKYLERHAGTLARAPRQIFYDQNPDKRWDGFGFSAGPIGDWHFMLQWHRFRAALRDAGFTSLPAPDEPGQYWCGSSRFDNPQDASARGTKILFLSERPGTVPLDIQGGALSAGNLHATSMRILSPQGASLLDVPRLSITSPTTTLSIVERPSSFQAAVEKYEVAAPQAGLHSIILAGHEIGIFQGLTQLPECQVLRRAKISQSPEAVVQRTKLSKGFLVPLARGRMELTFTAMGIRDGSHVAVRDVQGKVIAEHYLRAGDSATVPLDAGRNGDTHWQLDTFTDHSGVTQIAIAANEDEPLLYGRKLADVLAIRKKLGR